MSIADLWMTELAKAANDGRKIPYFWTGEEKRDQRKAVFVECETETLFLKQTESNIVVEIEEKASPTFFDKICDPARK